MKVSSEQKLYAAMKEGRVYRREELLNFSKALDRDLDKLVSESFLRKPHAGLYYRPKKSKWGEVPAEDGELVRAFLKTTDFLLTSSNDYNHLPLGLTQLSNVVTVYNRKRLGRFKLGTTVFDFRKPVNYPKKLDTEYLYVDLLNNLEALPEYSAELDLKIKTSLLDLSVQKLLKYAELYGKRSTQKKLNYLLEYA